MKKLGRPSIADQVIELWVSSQGKVKIESIFQENSLAQAYYNYFIPWADNNGRKLSNVTFNKKAKEFIQKYHISSITNLNGSISVEEKRDKPLDITYREKFDMIRTYSEMIREGYINSLIVHGTPGVGKDYNIKNILGEDAHYFSGGLKGSYELAKLLYEYRSDQILVFSDFDSVFKSVEQKNLLKTALEDEDERIITWVDKTNRIKKDQIPTQFKFTSGIIFVSNKKVFDEALTSRSVTIKIDMNTNQILDHIKRNLKSFMPKIPMEHKEEVINYLTEHKQLIKNIDFRQVKFWVATKISRPDKWQDWAKIQFK